MQLLMVASSIAEQSCCSVSLLLAGGCVYDISSEVGCANPLGLAIWRAGH